MSDAIIRIGDVVQYSENHPWSGCLGIVADRDWHNGNIRYFIGIPVPNRETIYLHAYRDEFYHIGVAAIIGKENR